MRDVQVEATVVFQWIDVVDAFGREAPEREVDVLMEQRHADLRIVDQIVRVLLPDAEAEVTVPNRDVAPKLDLGIAFGEQVELRLGGLQGKIEQLGRVRVDILK